MDSSSQRVQRMEFSLQDLFTDTATLASGDRVVFRPLRPEDADRFAAYLHGLSAETRSRYGPHPFDRATSDAICASLDPNDILRVAAIVSMPDGSPRMVAYFLLKMGFLDEDRKRYEALGIPLHASSDVTLAPSVADDYQNQGLGNHLMRHVLQVAKRLGRERVVLWGGVQATNDRAVHFYTRWGFRKVGEFYNDKNNFDMILALNAIEPQPIVPP